MANPRFNPTVARVALSSVLTLSLMACGSSPHAAPSPSFSGEALEALTDTTTVILYKDASRPVDDRVADLLARMTLEEKIGMISGNAAIPGGDGFASKPVPRLGIPELKMTDGPVGVRWEKSTAFPCSINMAASWDPALVERIGHALARETKGHGRNVLLGPCVNIHRAPLGGRNFESFGEDPYLAARMGVAYIQGVQAESVVATVKHFACNNQEIDRGFIDVKVSERALHEIYFPAFKAAVQEAGVGSVMNAYNKVNGAWCSENPFLLTQILKNLWGFRGFVMSDWSSVHHTDAPANAGLDIEMPGGEFLGAALVTAVRNGSVPVAQIDDKVRRMLRTMMTFGIFDKLSPGDARTINSAEHRALAREAGAASVVLLKNTNHLLPIGDGVRRIAVVGPLANVACYGGGGSSRVTPLRVVTPLDALRARCGTGIAIDYEIGCPFDADLAPIPTANLRQPGSGGAPGLKGEYFTNKNCEGTPALTRVDPKIDFNWGVGSPVAPLPVDGFSVRWTGRLIPDRTGDHEIAIGGDDGIRLFLDGRKVLDAWGDHAYETRKFRIRLVAGQAYELRIEYYENAGDAAARFGWRPPGSNTELTAAIAAAKRADLVLVFTGLGERFEYEGSDRAHLNLPDGQDALIEAMVAANPKTVVILQSGAPVLMNRWVDRVPSLLEAWYPGEEIGNVLTDILFGAVNPSAKLPTTFPRRAEDASSFGNYPGDHVSVPYEEGIFVGYRHFDRAKIVPLFPFGHGLSYTTFGYRNPVVRALGDARFEVTIEIGNTGTRAGAEVVQLYIASDHPSVERPPQELKSFRRIALNPGEWKPVSFTLGSEAFAFWDPARRNWHVDPGTYRVLLGSSSRDIRQTASVTIPPVP